jgi:hypothetical protein
MGVDLESFQDVLKHPIRRKIILALSQAENLSYTELMGAAEPANTGKFNYHLKILADLIQKDDSGKYKLTEKGHLAAQFLQTFKGKKPESAPLRMADALLIGFVGFALTVVNPGFWGFLAAANMSVKSMEILNLFNWLTFAFALIVPGFFMWFLAVRRSHNHDAYDLYKSPFITFGLLLALIIVMIAHHISVGATVSIQLGPTVSGEGWSHTTYNMTAVSLSSVLVLGMIFSLWELAISSWGHRKKAVLGKDYFVTLRILKAVFSFLLFCSRTC